ncbi:hypothetical protein ZEAMMB73_Zm00001d004004 [Zea mays]|uniref:Uncharacterized protein n=1 Tax=Zea mays TaxID=4577 RepID=A0A1D6ECV4_MAIZE|nr:hypothetical protein ZEAMMB73_Zm00001d004004 [Zea mays]
MLPRPPYLRDGATPLDNTEREVKTIVPDDVLGKAEARNTTK